MKKLFTLVLAMATTTILWAGTVITYTASEKLNETTEADYEGLHMDAFDAIVRSHTFYGGHGVIVFWDEVTKIGDYAFRYCEDLSSIDIPSSVTSIGTKAFMGCKHITTINIPEGVETIGEGAFSHCDLLKNVYISNTVTTIGIGAFSECFSLYTVEMGEGLTTIDNWAFTGCRSIRTITFPSSLKTIGWGAFAHCFFINRITCLGAAAPICQYDTFMDVENDILVLAKPGNVGSYKAAPYWKEFKRIEAL